MHLTYNHGIFIPKQAYLSIHKAKENQTHTRNPNIHLASEKPYHASKIRQQHVNIKESNWGHED